MRFGLQKLTLLDFPGLVACTVFTCGCNFACPFCHNASLVKGGIPLPYTLDDIVDFLKKRTGILDGVCITGGEPLMGDGALQLAFEAKKLGFKVKLDTNGSYPERLQEAVDKKLIDYVAMDIKSPREKYSMVCGNDSVLPAVEKSVEILKNGQDSLSIVHILDFVSNRSMSKCDVANHGVLDVFLPYVRVVHDIPRVQCRGNDSFLLMQGFRSFDYPTR